jgi:hypothetical protein
MNSVLFSGQPVEGSRVNSDQSSGSMNRTVQSNPGVEHGATIREHWVSVDLMLPTKGSKL